MVILYLLILYLSILYKINNSIQEKISEITSAKIKQIQIDSTFCMLYKFNNIILDNIFTINSKTWEIALLYAFLRAEKYPFKTLEIEINGNPSSN